MTPDSDATVNVNQAAQASGVSRRVLYYWMQHGKLDYLLVRGSRRVTLADVWEVKKSSWAGRKKHR
jgi:predicted site-specific integrase-resolvase